MHFSPFCLVLKALVHHCIPLSDFGDHQGGQKAACTHWHALLPYSLSTLFRTCSSQKGMGNVHILVFIMPNDFAKMQ